MDMWSKKISDVRDSRPPHKLSFDKICKHCMQDRRVSCVQPCTLSSKREAEGGRLRGLEAALYLRRRVSTRRLKRLAEDTNLDVKRIEIWGWRSDQQVGYKSRRVRLWDFLLAETINSSPKPKQKREKKKKVHPTLYTIHPWDERRTRLFKQAKPDVAFCLMSLSSLRKKESDDPLRPSHYTNWIGSFFST